MEVKIYRPGRVSGGGGKEGSSGGVSHFRGGQAQGQTTISFNHPGSVLRQEKVRRSHRTVGKYRKPTSREMGTTESHEKSQQCSWGKKRVSEKIGRYLKRYRGLVGGKEEK